MSAAKKYKIYHRLQLAAHTLKKSADRTMMEAADLTTAQAAVLAIIKDVEDISQKQVAGQLGLNESAMTAMVRRLTRLGYLSKRRSKDDGRAWCLTVTNSGSKALAAMRGPFGEINRQIDSMFDEAQTEELAHILNRLITRFQG